MNNTKKFLPFLATCAVCLVITIALLIVLPWLKPTNANTDTEKRTEEDHEQIDKNPSIDDEPNGGNQDHNSTDSTPNEPTEPVTPTPTPTEPTEPPTPEPDDSEPEPFILTVDSLPNTTWYDAEHQWRLTFTTKGYKLVKLIFDDDGNIKKKSVVEKGTWSLANSNIILIPSAQEFPNASGWEFIYANNVLTEFYYNYTFVWQTNG